MRKAHTHLLESAQYEIEATGGNAFPRNAIRMRKVEGFLLLVLVWRIEKHKCGYLSHRDLKTLGVQPYSSLKSLLK